MTLDDLMTTSEAAAALGISRQGVSALVRRGLLRALRLGYQNVFTREEVERYQRERRRPGWPKRETGH